MSAANTSSRASAESVPPERRDTDGRNLQDCHQIDETAFSRGAYRSNPLGDPISIQEVAELLGCSVWTVRQTYLPQGLPCLRARRRGKIVFFREQVTQWILKRQQKGSYRP